MSQSKTTEQSLFEEFPPISKEEWEKVITEDLRGADYKEKLRWETGEGIEPLPFYRREDMDQIDRSRPIPKKYADGNPNSWEIREPIFANSIEKGNQAARNALDRGAEALQFHLSIRRTEGMIGGDLQGLPIQDQEDFHNLLQEIPLADTTLHFDAGLASPALLAMLWNECQNQQVDTNNIWSTFGYDPFSYVLLNGHHSKEREALADDIRQLVAFTNQNLPGVRPLAIEARTFHNTGGTLVQELAFGLATAAEYLTILTEGNFEIDQVADSLHFNFSIGSNYFLEIAKFRAARLLWDNLIEAFGGNSTNNGAYLHGETSEWNKTLYDPYVNMLRTSTEGMSGAIAGCDSMTILPFDQHFRQPDDFSKRIARNQQIILSEEAYLDKVADPAAGSYYIEKLTDELGREAWQLFQEIETEGGILTAIENGTVQSAIEESQQKRDQAVAKRGRIFVGTNQYSNPDDKMNDKVDPPYQTVSLDETEKDVEFSGDNFIENLSQAFDKGIKMGDIVSHLVDPGKHLYRTVSPYRGTQAFEKLRLATEKHEHTPQVLTLPLGNKKWRKARSTFTSNFFGCVGYDIEDPIGFEDVAQATEAVKQKQPDIAVICSSDKEYQELVPKICTAFEKLKERPILVLAGYPKEDVESYNEAGIDEFIHAKCNVLETLKRFQTKLNVI